MAEIVDIIGFANIGMLCLDVLFIILALALKYWMFLDTSLLEFYSGLWEYCTELKGSNAGTTCTDIEDNAELASVGMDYDDIVTVRALMFLSLFLVIGGLACIIVKQFVMKEMKEILYAAAGVLLVAAIFLLTSWAFYRARIYKDAKDIADDLELHANFAFAIIAWLLTSVGVGLCVAMAFMKS